MLLYNFFPSPALQKMMEVVVDVIQTKVLQKMTVH